MSANFHCRPWNSHSSRPNCLRVSACSLATLKACRPSASEREALPSRSTLKPEICFLKPPGPSRTFFAGMRAVLEVELDQCSPFMKLAGLPT